MSSSGPSKWWKFAYGLARNKFDYMLTLVVQTFLYFVVRSLYRKHLVSYRKIIYNSETVKFYIRADKLGCLAHGIVI